MTQQKNNVDIYLYVYGVFVSMCVCMVCVGGHGIAHV